MFSSGEHACCESSGSGWTSSYPPAVRIDPYSFRNVREWKLVSEALWIPVFGRNGRGESPQCVFLGGSRCPLLCVCLFFPQVQRWGWRCVPFSPSDFILQGGGLGQKFSYHSLRVCSLKINLN